jgi:hypothetical protein
LEQDAQTVMVEHQPRPERRPDLSVMKILETQLAEIGVILLVLAHPVSRSAMRLPSKRALYQEILFAALQFWRERPNEYILGRIDDTRLMFASRAPFACRREHDQALSHRRLASESLPMMKPSLRLIRFELGRCPDCYFSNPISAIRRIERDLKQRSY